MGTVVSNDTVNNLIRIYRSLSIKGLVGECEDIQLRMIDGMPVLLRQGEYTDVSSTIGEVGWPVNKYGYNAYNVVIPGILDVPQNRASLAHKYANRGLKWCTSEDKPSILYVEPHSEYLDIREDALAVGDVWKDISVSYGLRCALSEFCSIPNALGSISRLFMRDGKAVCSIHWYNSRSVEYVYGDNSSIDKLMEGIVRELDSLYSRIDITMVVWYNIDVESREGYIKRLDNGDFTFLVV